MTINDFDAIYCLHLAESENRLSSFKSQFEKVGIWDKVQIWWTCKRNISNKVGNFLIEMHTSEYDRMIREYNMNTLYGGVFNCTFEHYTMIKTSYLRGFNHIMIFEDDITFDGDKEWFEQVLNKIPEDYDICKFHYTGDSDVSIPSFDQDIFKKELCHGSTMAFCMNRNGMKAYLDAVNEKYWCADMVFLRCKVNNFYTNKFKICKPNYEFGTEIQ